MQYQIQDIQRFVQRFYGTARLLVTPFGYPVVFPAMDPAVALQAQQSVNIQANADFVLTDISYKFGESNAIIRNKTEAACYVSFRESGSKEPFTDTSVALANYAYNGINQRPLDYPRFLAGASNIEVTLTLPNDAAQTYPAGLEILLNGFLVRVFN